MSASIIIRHAETKNKWDELSYSALLKLIRQEIDPPIDTSMLIKQIDDKQVLNLMKKIKVIYVSPLKRALQTAEYISAKTGIPIKIIPELREVRFNALPLCVHKKGKEAIRDFLIGQIIKKSEKKSMKRRVNYLIELTKEEALIITNSFLMRILFSELFRKKISQLRRDRRFTNYLTGFDCKNGKQLTFMM